MKPPAEAILLRPGVRLDEQFVAALQARFTQEFPLLQRPTAHAQSPGADAEALQRNLRGFVVEHGRSRVAISARPWGGMAGVTSIISV